jgi:hypothetical protein
MKAILKDGGTAIIKGMEDNMYKVQMPSGELKTIAPDDIINIVKDSITIWDLLSHLWQTIKTFLNK